MHAHPHSPSYGRVPDVVQKRKRAHREACPTEKSRRPYWVGEPPGRDLCGEIEANVAATHGNGVVWAIAAFDALMCAMADLQSEVSQSHTVVKGGGEELAEDGWRVSNVSQGEKSRVLWM